MAKIRVGVLRGGPSREYEVSLDTGASVINSLPAEKHEVSEIFISKDGVWHHLGAPISAVEASERFDVLFVGLHGEYGEDGTVQGLLDSLNARYTGSGKLGSSLAMNKDSSKKAFRLAGLKTPAYMRISHDGKNLVIERDGVTKELEKDTLDNFAKEIFITFPQPAVFKPSASGSSYGVRIVYGVDQISNALSSLIEEEDCFLIEEYIKGTEASCGVIEGFRNSDLYILPPVEIIPPKESAFFDYESKYGGRSEEICPGRFSVEIRNKILEGARIAHETLGLRHYSRSDFVVTKGGGVYILETNSLPGLTPNSLFPKSLEAIGSDLGELSSHLVSLAIQNRE